MKINIYNKNTKANKIKKFLITESKDKITPFSNPIPLKTFQDNSFKLKKSNELKRKIRRLEKGKQIINNLRRLSRHESIFITSFSGLNKINNELKEVKSPNESELFKNHIPRIKLQSNVNILKEYNVFESEDDVIKNIMYKFYIHENSKKPTKMEKKRAALDKIYGFSPYQIHTIRKAKKKKYLPLEEYQNNLLSSFAKTYKNFDQGKFIDLIQSMKDLKAETESISPLPKINIKTIRDHVLTKGTKNLKQISIKEYLSKDSRPMDEFEKENLYITKLKCQRSLNNTLRNRRNKNLDNLPEYLKEKFNNQIKYHG